MTKTHLIPTSLTAGLTLGLVLQPPNHPAPTWSLVLVLRGPSAVDITSAPAGTGHALSASALDTKGWLPGSYSYSLRALAGDDAVELERGQLQVLADLAQTPAGLDARTHAQRTLEAIEAVIEKRATTDQKRYRINNRELERTPIDELLKLRAVYRAEVNRQRRRGSALGRPVVHLL